VYRKVRDPFFVWQATPSDPKHHFAMIIRSTLCGLLFVPLMACAADDEREGLSGGEERQLEEAAAALDEAQAEFEIAIQQPTESDEADESTDH